MPFKIGHGLVTINPIGGVPPYGKRVAKGLQRVGLCALCNRERPITREHVISCLLFERDSDSLIRVPSCNECQKAKQAGEERLRDLVQFDVGAMHFGNQYARASVMARAHSRRPGKSTQNLLDRKQVDLISAGGIYLGEAFEAEWDYTAILRTMDFVIRGLWFHVERKPLPRFADVGVTCIPPLMRQRIASWLSQFPVSEIIPLGNGVAHVESFPVVRRTRIDSFWAIAFNGGVLFLGATGAYARLVRAFTDRRVIDGYYDPKMCYARR